MVNLGLSICVSGYDTENFQKAICKTEKQDFWKLISGMFTVMPKGSMASILVTVFKNGWMKAIVLTYIKKQLFNAGLHLRLHDVAIEELKNQMEIYCEVSNITFGDIYKLFFSYESESEEPYFEAVIRPMLRAMDETLPEDMKVSLLVNIINSCRDGLCKLLEEMLKSEYEIDLSLDKLYVRTVNQQKGAFVL